MYLATGKQVLPVCETMICENINCSIKNRKRKEATGNKSRSGSILDAIKVAPQKCEATKVIHNPQLGS